jgi:hypothetical protein
VVTVPVYVGGGRDREASYEEPSLIGVSRNLNDSGDLFMISRKDAHDYLQTKAIAKLCRYKVSVRQWRKRLGKSAEEVEAAVAKVGNNAETVIKELEAKHRYG